MTPIRRALRIDPDTVRTVVDHLDRHVAPHLAPDVSNYARGRQRAWLEIEAPLGPTQPWRPGLASHRLWPWLAAVWRRIHPDTDPQVGLAISGNTGIAWHRDASYAHARAVLVNLGPCTFRTRPGARLRERQSRRPRLAATPRRRGSRFRLQASAPGARRRSIALVRGAVAAQAAPAMPGRSDADPLNAQTCRCLTEYTFLYLESTNRGRRQGARQRRPPPPRLRGHRTLALTDPAGLTREDPDARGEARFVAAPTRPAGSSHVYAYRGDDVRLISARPARNPQRKGSLCARNFTSLTPCPRRRPEAARQDAHHDHARRRRPRRVPRARRRHRPRLPDRHQPGPARLPHRRRT